MWKKIKDILCNHTPYKDEPSMISIDDGTMMASVIDLGPSLTKSLQQTDLLHPEPLSKLATNTLNKTNEHCRSLFNLLPTSFRSRHYRQIQNKKCIDASTLTTPPHPSIDIIEIDYDSGYMSQNLLNRTPSYASCHSAMMPISSSSSINRYGSIENLLNGHSKSHPANLQIIVRKNFEPFAQAHIAVLKGTIVTALFSRGPWLYIRVNATGKTGYIPRMICSTMKTNHLSISSTDEQFNIRKMQLNTSKQPINRYLSNSSAIINDTKQHLHLIPFNERDRRHTYTLPHQTRSKERRSTQSTANLIPTRDTDSSSTQDSGYSDSTSFFLIQTSDQEQNQLEKEYRPQISLVNKYDNDNDDDDDTSKHYSIGSTVNRKTTTRRLPEFALIRNVRRDQPKSKPTINNLPKSHVQIPASIFLNHHRQKQQFGSSHSAFRPVQSKRASSEGHSPSSSSSSLSSSNSSLNFERRRLSFDLTHSVYDPTYSPKRIANCSRTMSEILCDQFSEINLDAIEKDSLIQQPRKSRQLQTTCLYTIVKDYRSSRASFTVKQGEFVHVLKQIGRSSYLVRKQINGQIGFLPKTLVIPSTSTRIETFLETHGYRETII